MQTCAGSCLAWSVVSCRSTCTQDTKYITPEQGHSQHILTLENDALLLTPQVEWEEIKGADVRGELFGVVSDFVQVNVYADTNHLTPEQRMWLELYRDIAFELPVMVC